MSSLDGTLEFEYKVGAIDKVVVQLKDATGSPINLTGAVVVFSMTPTTTGSQKTLTSTLGATVDGETKTDAEGYLTLDVSSDSTATALEYEGEFIITVNGLVGYAPPNGDFYKFKVYPKK
jgi:hypothetical protein